MSDDLEEILLNVSNIVYDSVKQYGIGDRAYERAMSEELMDRGIKHETHKKVFDERKGKYKFIDIYFPDYSRFAKLKTRKYITRTEIAELKEEEMAMGIEGMIINFYNGVSIRHSTSGRVRGGDFDQMIGFHSESQRQQHKRMTLPHLSGSTSRLSDMAEPTYGTRGSKYTKYPPTVIPLNDESRNSFKNADKIFSLSCAAFFLSEGNRRDFAELFNDLLEEMKLSKISIPDKFLNGPKMKTPDGELGDTLKRIFSAKANSRVNENGKSEIARNGSAESETHAE